MYDRAGRKLTTAQNSTAEHVGPGAYETELLNQKRIRAGIVGFTYDWSVKTIILLQYGDIWISLSAYIFFSDGYAPFLSMTGRDSCLNPADTVIATPGPGQYDPGLPQTHTIVSYFYKITYNKNE